MDLFKYIARRILTSSITLITLLTAIYFIFRLPAYLQGVSPVNTYLFSYLVGHPFTPPEKVNEIINAIRRSMGLPPKGASVKTRLFYFLLYLKNMLTFNFGWSTTLPPKKIMPQVLKRLPYTLTLIGPSIFFSIILGMRIAPMIAKKPGTKTDKGITISGLILSASPVYWLGTMLLFIFGGMLNLYPPSRGVVLPGFKEVADPFYAFMGQVFMMLLPLATIVLGLVGSWIYLMRNLLVKNMTERYIFTARAKGLDETAVLYKHAFKNALLPFWTNVVLSLSALWAWVIYVEILFEIPGVGMLFYNAVVAPFDYSTAQTLTFFISLTVIVGNLLSDIAYVFVDPQVRYTSQ